MKTHLANKFWNSEHLPHMISVSAVDIFLDIPIKIASFLLYLWTACNITSVDMTGQLQLAWKQNIAEILFPLSHDV